MKIFELAFELFILYLLYKLVFDFIIPVANATKKVKKQFGDMSAQMEEKMKQQRQQATQKTPPPSSKQDDYIDYEEVK
jgi:Sec-independent protein translocase protein TatA